MADKILTLTQESTGDNVYPNVKEENLPTEWVKTLVDKEYLTTNYYNKAYIDNNLYTKAYQDVYFLTKDSAEKTYATITSVNTISKKVDSLDTLAHQTDEDLQQYKAITYTKTDIDDNFISIATALTNEDLDTLKTEGSYYAGGSNTCTNKPTGIDAFGLTIKRVASGYYTQYLTGGNTNTGQVYTRTFTSGAWTSWIKFTQDTQLATKQDKLVSGTNIKSINGNSLLGSGDLTIESGGSSIIIRRY